MHSGERIKEERERLGLNQIDFAALASSTRKTLFNWESGAATPNATVLAAWAAHGLDVLYVVTGQRSPLMPATDPAEQVLLDSYRRCGAQARQNLIQTAALLSAGISTGVPTGAQPASVKVSSKHGHAAGRDVNVNTEGSVNGKQGNLKPRGARSGT